MPGPGTAGMASPPDPAAGAPALPGPVVIDITRSLSRIDRDTPTGIDRIEAAWIAHLSPRADLWFTARIPGGRRWFPRAAGLALLREGASARLDLRGMLSRRPEAVRRAASLARRTGRRDPPPGINGGVWFNLGHAGLDEAGMRALARMGVRRVVMIHDTIPLDHPAFASRASVRRFPALLRAAAMADAILTPSHDSAARVAAWLGRWGLDAPPIHPVAPGVDPPARVWAPDPEPCCLVLGTIEPRKGHDLLLDVWQMLGAAAPVLHVVGRPGWADARLLARLADPPPRVRVHGPLSDAALAGLMARCHALLMPSLAEGYGLPAAEARAMGLPAILSDLPALREAGGPRAVYLPPGDRAAWAGAVRSLAARPPRAPLTMAQDVAAMLWPCHFETVARVLA
ncbi:MAG: glycosyltransferase family 1 protein [Alphaproteobacteria bacterium]|nr:MAG: glycosyltransferase family 1 protein [Alphaproteobacteria bacterium]